jgi:Ni/Fe-hydrogenase subunit HybB-like protein
VVKKWQKSLYSVLAFGWTGNAKAWQRFEEVSLVLAGLATPLVFSVHSVVSMDFATSLVPGWHSTIYPPYFVAGAIFSGFAMVQTLLLVMRKAMKLEAYVTRKHVEYMNIVIMVTGGIVAVAYATEFFMGWYSGVEYEYYTYMSMGAATGQYSWAFWALIICNILIPGMLWFKAVRTSFFWAWAISIVINVGMWFERFDIIVLCLHRDYMPSGWTMFYPTWVDVGTFLGTIGIFFTLYLLFARYFPVLAFNELKTILKSSGESYKGEVLPKSQH